MPDVCEGIIGLNQSLTPPSQRNLPSSRPPIHPRFMKFRLLMDHARRRATLHAEECGPFKSRGDERHNLDEFWSAAHFDSEAVARSAVLDPAQNGGRRQP